MNAEVVYSIFYFLLSFYIIYPPLEFISEGFTIASLFSSLLGFKHEKFIDYHIRLSILNLFIYSLLPLGYGIGLYYFGDEHSIFSLQNSIFWQALATTCLVLPILAIYQIIQWSYDNWKNHPTVKNICKFSNNNSNWLSIVSDINNEFRSVDKTIIQTSSVCEIIATENWILKITPLTIFVAHQSDSQLTVEESDTHFISENNERQVQYVTILVKSSRENVDSFKLRLNVKDFRDLQNRLSRTIEVLPNITFHKNILEKFVMAFKEEVHENIRYVTNQELDLCIGCMQTTSNVKLQKLCISESDVENCTTCYCKPLWCIDCMARWFAARQDAERPNVWLASKCSCPMCRATFCILDVCLVENEDEID